MLFKSNLKLNASITTLNNIYLFLQMCGGREREKNGYKFQEREDAYKMTPPLNICYLPPRQGEANLPSIFLTSLFL